MKKSQARLTTGCAMIHRIKSSVCSKETDDYSIDMMLSSPTLPSPITAACALRSPPPPQGQKAVWLDRLSAVTSQGRSDADLSALAPPVLAVAAPVTPVAVAPPGSIVPTTPLASARNDAAAHQPPQDEFTSVLEGLRALGEIGHGHAHSRTGANPHTADSGSLDSLDSLDSANSDAGDAAAHRRRERETERADGYPAPSGAWGEPVRAAATVSVSTAATAANGAGRLTKPARPPPPPPASTKPSYTRSSSMLGRDARRAVVSFALDTHTGMSDSTIDDEDSHAAVAAYTDDSVLPGAVGLGAERVRSPRMAWGGQPRPESMILDNYDAGEYAETDI